MSTSHIPTSTLSSYPPGSEQSRPRNRPRLGFQEAMENFSTMFPTMDRSIIEAVLRSCNGHIQRTIDKLLVMTDSSPTDEILTGGDQPQIVSLSANTDTSSNSTNLPLGSTENNQPDMLLSIDQSFGNNNNNRDNNIYDNNLNLHNNNNAGSPTTYTSKYHPPLVGRLPDDFLRIKPTRSSHRQTPTYDPVALQMMEDERLAKWLQNEEFMRHLQSNEDFVRSLETEHNHHNRRSRRQGDRPQQQYQQLPQQHTIPPTEVIARNTEDAGAVGGRDEDESYNKKKLSTAEFREKLKTMGSSTREKFYQLANKFNRKKKPNSSRQLLLDCDDFDVIPDQSDMDYGATESPETPDYMNNNNSSPTRSAATDHSASNQLNNQMDQSHAVNNANSTVPNRIDPVTGRILEPVDPFTGRR